MAFSQSTFAPIGAHSSGVPSFYSYSTADAITTVLATDYFLDKRYQLSAGEIILVSISSIVYFLEVVSATSATVTTRLTVPKMTDDGSGNIGVTGSLTIAGNVVVDTDLFYIDVTNDILGIDTLVPTNKLDVEGGINQRDFFWCQDFDDEVAAVEFESGLVADAFVTAGTNYASSDVTYTAGAGGTLALVTAGADNDSVTIFGPAIFRTDNNPVMEARFKIADIANAYIAVGFAEGSYADKAAEDDDIAVVGIDSDNAHTFGADTLIFTTNDTGAGVVISDCTGVMVNATWITIKIDLTDTEQPRVWYKADAGEFVEVAAADITGTVQAGISIAPYIMVQSLSGAADTLTIDYIKAWQDRA